MKNFEIENSLYSVHDPLGVKLLSRLRLQFSLLNEHKFTHGSNDTVNPMCPCRTEVETNAHFLLCCHCFSSQRPELFDNLYNLDPSFSRLDNKEKVVWLYDSISDPNTLNKVVINFVNKFLKSPGRSDNDR